jgi:hypothetical protein
MDQEHGGFQFTSEGQISVLAPQASSKHDFDFIIGHWDVHNRMLKSRLTGSDDWKEFDFKNETRMILNGFGNVDESGSTMRIFDPETRIWTIHSAFPGATAIDKMKGFFENGIGRFYGLDEHEGKPAICQFQWDATNPDAPVWSQALSIDNGETWEWNWSMHFTRRSDRAETFLYTATS